MILGFYAIFILVDIFNGGTSIVFNQQNLDYFMHLVTSIGEVIFTFCVMWLLWKTGSKVFDWIIRKRYCTTPFASISFYGGYFSTGIYAINLSLLLYLLFNRNNIDAQNGIFAEFFPWHRLEKP